MKSNRLACILCWIAGSALLLLAAGTNRSDAAESLPEGLKVVSMEAFPPAIDLTHRFDYRQVVVMGKVATGESVDLTRMAKISSSPAIVSVSPNGLVRPVSD